MEDERVISLTARNSKITAEFLLKMLYYCIGKLYEMNRERNLGSRIFLGETEWNKFMESIDPIQIKDFQNNEVNLEKFKEELNNYNIGFAFYKHGDGKTVSLAYSLNHKDIVEKAITNTIEKIVSKDEFLDKVKKSSKENTLEEKLNYYKEQNKNEFRDMNFHLNKKDIKIKEKSL